MMVSIRTLSGCAGLAQGNPMQNSRITPIKLVEHYRYHGLKDGRAGVFVFLPSRLAILQRSACTRFLPKLKRQTVKLRVPACSGL